MGETEEANRAIAQAKAVEQAKAAEQEQDNLEVERIKLQIERDKLKLEGSWRKLFAAPLLAAVVTAGIALLTLMINNHQSDIANTQAATEEKQQEGQWGISVLDLYVTNPDAFDPTKSATASQNLNALAVSAPDVMKPILLQRQDTLVRQGLSGAASSTELRAIAGAISAATQGGGDWSSLAEAAGTAKPTTLPGLQGQVVPSQNSIYIQYRPNSLGQAEAVAAKLRASRFRVPEAELVKESPSKPEVRYYQADQKPLAEWIANSVVGNDAAAILMEQDNFPGLPTHSVGGVFEVWLP